jgi:hypothetical protein
LHFIYGSKFEELWKGLNEQELKAFWADALEGYTSDEIKTGLNACMTRIFPPTLPEFLMLCRKPIDPQQAFIDACNGKFANEAIRRTARKIGSFDLQRTTWAQIKTRWTNELAFQQSQKEPVAKPGQSRLSTEQQGAGKNEIQSYRKI